VLSASIGEEPAGVEVGVAGRQAGRPRARARTTCVHGRSATPDKARRRPRAAPHNTHVHAACLLLLRVPAPAHALQLSIGPYGQQRRQAQMSVRARTRASTHAAQQVGGSKLGRTAEDRLGGGVGAGGVGVRAHGGVVAQLLCC